MSRPEVRRWVAGRIFARSNDGRTITPAPVIVVPGKQQAPENSHVIRLKEVSTNAENVAIPTRRIKDLKQSQENYVRNWCASAAVHAAGPVGGGGALAHQNDRHRRCGGRRRDRRPGCGGRGRRQGLAGLRDRPLRAIRLACGDLAGGPPPTGAPSSPAPLQDQTALGTPAGPQTQTQQSGPEPFGSGPPSMLSGCRRCATANQHRTRRVSSARPPCRPCRSSRR